jgi:hypothetical protein
MSIDISKWVSGRFNNPGFVPKREAGKLRGWKSAAYPIVCYSARGK